MQQVKRRYGQWGRSLSRFFDSSGRRDEVDMPCLSTNIEILRCWSIMITPSRLDSRRPLLTFQFDR